MRSYIETRLPISHYLVIAAAVFGVCVSAGAAERTSQTTGLTPSKVNVELYYESLCYDSIQFVKNQLVPTYRQLGDYFTVTFIPYGKASQQRITDGNGFEKWHFDCQHGPAECYGNKAQACAINDILISPNRSNKQQDLVNFVGCVMSARNLSSAVPECLRSISVDENHIVSLVNKCISSTSGDDLLAAYGHKTLNLQPNISFVPTILINGVVFSQTDQDNALGNFKGFICQYIPVESRPIVCNGSASPFNATQIVFITIFSLVFCLGKGSNSFL